MITEIATAQTTEDPIKLLIGYDGPALEAGRMDVRVLAGAMASVAQLVDDSARLSYGVEADLRIEVSGDFRRGSFSFLLVTTALSGLTQDQVRNLLEWLGLIGAPTGITVVGILKWLRGRKPDKVVRKGNQVEITAGDESKITNIQIGTLVFNPTIRANLEGMTQPLGESGINVLRAGEEEAPAAAEITHRERDSFLAPPPSSEVLNDSETETVLQVVAEVRRIGNKWQFAYPGEGPFFAPVLDKRFLRQLQDRKRGLLWGDLLKVRLRTRITRTELGGLNTVREVLKVLDVIPPAKQVELFDEEGTEGGDDPT